MKIAKIKATDILVYKNNKNESTKINSQTQPKFKGLWGETTYDSYTDREHQDEYVCHNYYPFKDETKQEIENTVKEHSYYNSWAADTCDAVTQTMSISVAVCSVLPFTSKDFRAFLNNSISDLKRMIIEKHVFEKNLRHKF